MFDRLLPKVIDNTYRGQKPGLWLFGLLVLMKLVMSMGIIFNGANTAVRADGIPLDTYPAAAAQTIVALFALYGYFTFVICALGILVLARYRSMIAIMFALLLVEHLGRKLILQFLPIVRVGAPPASAINLGLLTLILIGLALSLWPRKSSEGPR